MAVIIEDKVKSSEHSNQLEKYYNKISHEGFEKEQIIPIYLKTGFQHDFNNVLNKGYHFYSVHDLMNVFEFGKDKGIKNEIFLDFYEYLSELQTKYQEDEASFLNFSEKKIKDWNWWNWIGFFNKNSESLNAKWGIVPNRRENLVALWFGGTVENIIDNNKEIIFHPYIDVKYSGWNRFTFSYRLGLNGNPQNDKRLRDEMIKKVKGRIEEKGIEVKTPKFTKAKHTIELLKVININEEMNEIEIVEFLRKMESALKEK